MYRKQGQNPILAKNFELIFELEFRLNQSQQHCELTKAILASKKQRWRYRIQKNREIPG
ncbi:hypothetical protein Cal6303_4257 [Calothrix sp. PCC 6303]|nr:hypothetical protein Cal6303_4257 [Calothrix sp. PCC 6303]